MFVLVFVYMYVSVFSLEFNLLAVFSEVNCFMFFKPSILLHVFFLCPLFQPCM